MKNEISFSRINNFNIIRLLAAFQVVVLHGVHHLNIETEWLLILCNRFLVYLPGVPIFFFISGFLIYWSFERNSTAIKKYFKNRFLRIFPALWVCVILTIILLLISVENYNSLITNGSFYLWMAAQFSFFQFYTPDILRFWGCGAPNGSLWTIVVELQFYLLVPIIYYFTSKSKKNLFFLLLLSICINIFLVTMDKSSIFRKLGGVLVLPYLYYFVFGILAYIYWAKVKFFIQNKFLFWLIIYMIWNYFFDMFLGIETYSYWIDSPVNLISDVLLLFLTFSAATTNSGLSKKILGNADISYGVYIYHMLIINVFISFQLTKNPYYLLLILAIVSLISYLSWVLIEKPSLNLKKKPILSKENETNYSRP